LKSWGSTFSLNPTRSDLVTRLITFGTSNPTAAH
jgi:hypothetical protein